MSVSQISLRTSRCTNCCRALAQKFAEIGAKIGRLFCHLKPPEAAASGHALGDRSLVPQNAEISVEESSEDNSLLSVDVSDSRIDPRSFNAGLIYTIYSPSTKTSSYLIGTSHDPLYGHMAEQNPFLLSIIARCARVYTERGEPVDIESIDPNDPETWVVYDEVIAQMAVRENKTLIGLDLMTGVIARENAFKKNAQKNQLSYTFAEEAYATFGDTANFDPQLMNEIQNYLAIDPEDHIDAWVAGNTEWLTKSREEQSRRFPRFNEKLTVAREQIWLAALSNDLQSTQSPICIAVGCNHLVGNDGMAAQLEKLGFEVQQVRFSDL